MATSEQVAALFLEEYSSIDSSLVLAIVSDHDLTVPAGLRAVRDVLESLQLSAKEEEESGFDASASSAVQTGDNDSGSGKSLPGWSSSTDDTELTAGVLSLDIDGYSENSKSAEELSYGHELAKLDQGAKESMLVEMFPGLKPFDIQWTLRKGGWDVNKAINELMTQSFMEENGTRRRGIEAFSESDLPSQVRKGKGKKKKYRAMEDPGNPVTPGSPTSSKWDTGKQDVEFIATRTGKSLKEIASLYHKNGASIRTTIIALLDAQAALNIECDDPVVQSNVIDLGQEFPSLPPHLISPLIKITHPSSANAHELAKALVFKPVLHKSNIQIEFRHAPIELDHKPLNSTSSNVLSPKLSLDDATTFETRYSKEREVAFTQARAAYRKGKSDHLMGGAAAYYSEVGRAADSQLKKAQSAKADAHTAAQSSRTQLDLHGVNVQDGKRIAQERVRSWWHELGEGRSSNKGVGSEYRIVTGVGHHSEGGKSKLAPAVLKMLMSEGYKVKVETGVLVVTGVTGIAKRK